ncbi:MAG: hypothetical protein SPL47_02705 [Bacteroidales bacterium]|nr:hypothetical protein [Bacteroidales bacterium]
MRKFVFEGGRFRQFLSSLAEWCATFKEKGGKKMGGGRETSGNGSYFPAAHLLSLGLT